jgi:hypothetical protein
VIIVSDYQFRDNFLFKKKEQPKKKKPSLSDVYKTSLSTWSSNVAN